MRVLLLGPPNVGKSVLFNRLTGLDVGMANYPGTTIDYKKGTAEVDGMSYELIDAPGSYTLDASNEAEQVAVDMLESEPIGVVCVLDAKNLENGLYLLLQALEKKLPTIAVVNKNDLIEGSIDKEFLSEKLGIPVIETVAVKEKGLSKLKDKIKKFLNKQIPIPQNPPQATWEEAEELEKNALESSDSGGKSLREKWGDKLVEPFPGVPIAIAILLITFGFVVGVGGFLGEDLLIPFFENEIFPHITSAVEQTIANETAQNILIGEYGFLIRGIEWPFGLVLPYILTFYTGLSILEDTGYLPRLAVLIDGLFKKMSLSGSHIISLMLGYGCAIPAILSTRTMKNRTNRIILSSMVALAIPCVAQSGAFIALLAQHSIFLVVAIFTFSIIAAIIAGLVMGRFMKGGEREPMIQEVPDLLVPDLNMLGKKIWIRVKSFLTEGALPMIIIIGVASVLYEVGIMGYIGKLLEPMVTGWLRLPSEASTPLILGIFRRELTVLPLLEMGLSTLQLFVGAVIALFYIPCLGTIGVLGKELGLKVTAGIVGLTILVSFTIGGIIAQIGTLLF